MYDPEQTLGDSELPSSPATRIGCGEGYMNLPSRDQVLISILPSFYYEKIQAYRKDFLSVYSEHLNTLPSRFNC